MRKEDIIVFVVLVLSAVYGTRSELVAPGARTNTGHSLSAEVRDYRLHDNLAEVNPTHEGFILLTDNQKKPPPFALPSTTAAPMKAKQTSTARSFSNVTATTTCTTKQKTTSKRSTSTTRLFKSSSNRPVNATEEDSLHRRGRRILNAASYDTDSDTSITYPLFDDGDHNDEGGFLRVDDDELTRQLVNLAAMSDGSGFSK